MNDSNVSKCLLAVPQVTLPCAVMPNFQCLIPIWFLNKKGINYMWVDLMIIT